MMASGVHTDGNKKKVSISFKDKRRFWVEIDKKYHRLFNDPSLEEDYWEDLDEYLDTPSKKSRNDILKKLREIQSKKEDIQEKGKVIDINRRTA